MPKNRLRQALLAQRKKLSSNEANDAGDRIQQAFISSRLFQQARVIVLYSPVHNEVATAKIFAAARHSCKAVLYPVVVRDDLLFRKVDQVEQLMPGRYGIFEPGPECQVEDPGTAGAIVVPGVAFDCSGRRLGYGKGYYDRALHRLEGKGIIVGICYDFQLQEEILDEPHDVRVDLLISEKRVIGPRHLHI